MSGLEAVEGRARKITQDKETQLRWVYNMNSKLAGTYGNCYAGREVYRRLNVDRTVDDACIHPFTLSVH